MKKVNILTLVAVLITLLTASCGQNAIKNESAKITFKTIDVEDFVAHPQATDDEQGLHYKIKFIYPEEYGNKEVLATLQSKFIEYVLGKEYVSLTPDKAVETCVEEWKKGYAEDLKGTEYEDIPGYALSYVYFCSDTISFVNDALLQMIGYSYTYAGGAHGFGGFIAHLFNFQTGKEYTRNDIFKTEKETDIRRLIIAEIPKYIEDGDTFEEDAVWTEETDFALTDEGISFLYSDYELGSYSLGSLEIPVPFAKILPCLRENTPVWEAVNNKANKNK